MARLFISHSSQDNAAAIALRGWLAEQGWDDVFLDLDPERGIVSGERWERALHQAAQRCEAVIFLISQNWLRSDWCAREYDLADRLGKRLFGVVLDDTRLADIPARYTETWQLTSLGAGQDGQIFAARVPPDGSEAHVVFSRDGLRRLRAGLQRAGLDPRHFEWPPTRDPQRPPYRGLRPLEAEDAGIFFGRDAALVGVFDQLRRLQERAAPRLLVILGASGAGKSSFLRAGLLPRLARDDRYFLTLRPIRPERDALNGEHGLVAALHEALARFGRPRARPEISADARTSEGLVALLAALAEAAQPPMMPGAPTAPAPAVVLSVDQAEELFLAEGTAQARLFLEALAEAARSEVVRVIVLFTIRTDLYGPLQSAPSLEGLRQELFSLPPMPIAAYREVIEGPARRLGGGRVLRVPPQLTESLAAEAALGGGDALPLLAFTLEKLWHDHGTTGVLAPDGYDAAAGFAEAMNAAVERALDAAVRTGVAPADEGARLALLRHGLIPWLAGIDPATKAPRRRRARIAEIPAEARGLMEHLVEARLLTTDMDDAEAVIEPAHEALLRRWGLLKGWLEEDLALLVALESVLEAARDWEASRREVAWLAHRGGRLSDAEALRERGDFWARLGASGSDYLAACRREEDERRDRELRAAQDLAVKEAARAEAEAQGRKRARMGLGAAMSALLVAVGAAGWAWWQQGVAETRRAEAERQEQVAEAERSRAEVSAAQALEAGRLAEEGRADARRQAVLAIGNESRALAALGLAAVRDGRGSDATRLALASWPRSIGDDRLMLRDALQVMSEATGTALRLTALPMRHEREVAFAAFSPDGTRVVTASLDHTARLWDTATGAPVGPLMRHDGAVLSATFSPDGSRVVTASEDRTARLWDVATGAPVGPPMRHDGGVVSAAFSPDGRRVVTASWDMTARLWDATTGGPVGAPMRINAGLNFATFSPDGRHVVTASSDGTARFWHPETGAPVGAPMRHDGDVVTATFSPDSRRLVTASQDHTARLWDVTTGAPVGAPMRHDGHVVAARFSPDGRRVVTASEDRTARLWDAATGAPVGTPMQHHTEVRSSILSPSEDLVVSAAFSPDGRRVVTASGDGTARLWDAATGAPLGSPIRHDGAVVSAAFSPDGRRVVTASVDHTARLWDVTTGGPIGVPMQHDGGVMMSAVLSPDGRRVVTASTDRSARLWDAATGAPVGEPMLHQAYVQFATFSPDSSRVVTASGDGTARLWETASGASVGTPMRDGGLFATFSPDGRRVVTSSGSLFVRLWDAATGTPVGRPMRHDGENEITDFGVYHGLSPSVTFSPDGRRLVTGSWNRTARLWDVETGAPLGTLMRHESRVTSATFSPDGGRVVTTSEDSTARLWDAATGEPAGPPMRHQGRVVSAAFSPDSRRVVTASSDHTARLWDVATGAPVGSPMRHVGEVAFATFSPDGTRVVTASSDQTARLWDVVTSTPIGPPMRHEGGVVSATFSPDGRRVVTRSSDSSARLWDVSWPSGNIVEIACAFLADHDLRDPQQRFGFVLDQPICQPPPPFDPARIIER